MFLRKPQSIQAIYLYLVLGNTLAASFIWGINTIFLLDAGLNNFQAFLANAFFMLGQVLFEVPTGVIADTFGRRFSYLLGAFTLMLSTIFYLLMWQYHGPFWGWAISSILLGLGFTFFSGALEAWLVDALRYTGFKGSLDGVFARGQIVGGVAMLAGSLAGGILAQFTNLGAPYILRSAVLLLNFATAFFLMRDLGFTPRKISKPLREVKAIFKSSIAHGFSNPPVRWLMLSAPFTMGVSFYVFYALQPFLLQLYGDRTAYWVAGLVAAIAALSQIAGGMAASRIKGIFRHRTSAILGGIAATSVILAMVYLVGSFWTALALIFLWGLLSAAVGPIRQTYLNKLIPSEQRATILSLDSLMGSAGGVVAQPVLGRAADLWGYALSYLLAAGIQSLALPFVLLSKMQRSEADRSED